MPRGDFWPHWTVRLKAASQPDGSGCVIWRAALNSRGYGVIWFDGRLHLAHRAAWFERYGTWPRAGFVLDHICERRACVNVAHLRELTNEQNIRRSVPNYGIGGSQRVV